MHRSDRRRFLKGLASLPAAAVIKKLVVEPGQTVVITCPTVLSPTARAAINRGWDQFCQSELGRRVPMVILDGGMDIRVLEIPSEGSAAAP